MKKLTYVLVFLLMFAISSGVEAKKVHFDCGYTINFSKVHTMATNQKTTFHIIYYDDGSVDSSQLKKWDGTKTIGNVIMSTTGFNKSFAAGVKDYGACPEVAFQFDGNQLINPRVMSFQTEAEDEKDFVKADHKEGSAESETGEEEATLELVCRKHIKAMREESSWDVWVAFYKQGKKRIFGTSSSLNGTESRAEIKGMTTVGGYTYQVSNEMIKDVYDSGNCSRKDKNYKFYLECDHGNSQKIKFVLNKPDDTVNCSYDVKSAEKDDGSDKDKNPASGYRKSTPTSHWNSQDGNTNKFLKKVWGMLKVIVPVLVVILSIADFLKTLIVSDEKNYKEGFIRFLKRIGVAIILFVLPAIIKLLLDLAGMSDVGIFEVFS